MTKQIYGTVIAVWAALLLSAPAHVDASSASQTIEQSVAASNGSNKWRGGNGRGSVRGGYGRGIGEAITLGAPYAIFCYEFGCYLFV